ncbi:MAG: hypothetical protein FWC68_06325, partial [Oscillospiraceae bacterium]|nr:hypothetical protein [Oscillospiraceae bacterium]
MKKVVNKIIIVLSFILIFASSIVFAADMDATINLSGNNALVTQTINNPAASTVSLDPGDF